MPEAARGRVMDLRDLAWMVRRLDEPVSAVHLFPDGGLIAGGWERLRQALGRPRRVALGGVNA
jgi:hypothetical protein